MYVIAVSFKCTLFISTSIILVQPFRQGRFANCFRRGLSNPNVVLSRVDDLNPGANSHPFWGYTTNLYLPLPVASLSMSNRVPEKSQDYPEL